MNPKFSIAQGVVFFALCFAAILAVEMMTLAGAGMLTNSRVIPRGPGWIVLPVLAGLAGWTFGQQVGIQGLLKRFGIKLLNWSNRKFRAWSAGATLWALVACTVFTIFDPFGRYRWREDEWIKFLFILFGPPIIGLIGIQLFEWVLKDSPVQLTANSSPSATKYEPSEAACNTIFLCLIALSVIEGNIDDKKLDWIKMFHDQLRAKEIEQESVVKVAKTLQLHGPLLAKGILSKNRDQMSARDRELLIKSCCLMVSAGGPMSLKERDMILDLATVMEITKERLWNL